MFVAAVLQGLASTALASGDQRLLPRANVLPVWEGLTEVDCRIVFEEIFERLEAERASGDPGFREPGIAMSCFTFPADQGNEAGQFYERAIAEGGWQAIRPTCTQPTSAAATNTWASASSRTGSIRPVSVRLSSSRPAGRTRTWPAPSTG